MDKYEFITSLQRHLTGKISAGKLKEITAYYNDYIDSQIRKGKSEEEVLAALGDPRLLAKTIVETEGKENSAGYETVYEERDEEKGNGRKGIHIKIGAPVFWILICLALFLILYLVFSIIGLALGIFIRFVLPVAVPVVIACLIIGLFRKR